MKELKTPALTRWEKADKTYENYTSYLDKKTDKFHLTFIDLLYVSNFKGGNSTINGLENEVNDKLKHYSEFLKEVDDIFKDKELRNLTENELEILFEKVQNVFDLVKDSNTKIDGFSYSYLSALLHFYFPKLLPILDRRVLISSKIVCVDDIKQVDKQYQIIQIENYYDDLIRFMREKLQKENYNLRDLDKELFQLKIPKRKI